MGQIWQTIRARGMPPEDNHTLAAQLMRLWGLPCMHAICWDRDKCMCKRTNGPIANRAWMPTLLHDGWMDGYIWVTARLAPHSRAHTNTHTNTHTQENGDCDRFHDSIGAGRHAVRGPRGAGPELGLGYPAIGCQSRRTGVCMCVCARLHVAQASLSLSQQPKSLHKASLDLLRQTESVAPGKPKPRTAALLIVDPNSQASKCSSSLECLHLKLGSATKAPTLSTCCAHMQICACVVLIINRCDRDQCQIFRSCSATSRSPAMRVPPQDLEKLHQELAQAGFVAQPANLTFDTVGECWPKGSCLLAFPSPSQRVLHEGEAAKGIEEVVHPASRGRTAQTTAEEAHLLPVLSAWLFPMEWCVSGKKNIRCPALLMCVIMPLIRSLAVLVMVPLICLLTVLVIMLLIAGLHHCARHP
eukprot:1159506-Pelagomonas_calceolata.AAC.4